jgi:hypothetical protein
MKPHYFSPQEANAALELIRPLMQEIQSIRAGILANRPDVWPAIERSAGNGGNPALSRTVRDFERLDDLVHRILSTGAQIKDINTGLLDFLAWRVDHEVYLCWKHGEPEIQFWHEISAGFAGRQPIAGF